MTCCWTGTRMACCSCWLVVLLLVVTGLVLPLLLGQGGHVLISSYAKRNPSLRIVGENYCCLYFCFVLFLLLSLAYSHHCYHVVWLYFPPCCCIVVIFCVVVHVVAIVVGSVPSSSSSSLSFVIRCCCHTPLLVAITVYCCFMLFALLLLLLFLSMRLLCS